jgi:hypothetical protein
MAGSLAVAGGAFVVAAVPAAAGPPPPGNYAYGSWAPAGAIKGAQNGRAQAPPAETTVAYNVNIYGLLSTGTTTDTAGASSAYAKVTYPSASTSWTVGPTTYTLSLSASQVASYCTSKPLTSSVNIISGVLTETATDAVTGVLESYQLFNLPQLPARNQTYSYNWGTVTLNHRVVLGGPTLETQGINVITSAGQKLVIAVTGCTPPVAVINP